MIARSIGKGHLQDGYTLSLELSSGVCWQGACVRVKVCIPLYH